METNLISGVVNQAKVTVLVPVYNVEPFIERCAHSLFRQTYGNIEFVFANDCTSDKSIVVLKKIIEQYPDRKDQITILEHSQNKGIGATRNSLLKAATGDYLMWVDSDDFISEDAVEVLVSKIEEYGSDIITSDSYFFYKGENNSVTFSQQFQEDSHQYIDAIACHQARAALWGTLSKRSLWVENKITILESSTFAEDYFATVQLFYFSKKNQVIHFPFYYYNQININSYTTGYKSENHFISLIKLFENLSLFFQKHNVESEYNLFLKKARITEFSGLLLHTTANLRRRYSYILEIEEITHYYKDVFISKWQYFILKEIVLKNFILSDLLILIAKILRMIFKLKF